VLIVVLALLCMAGARADETAAASAAELALQEQQPLPSAFPEAPAAAAAEEDADESEDESDEEADAVDELSFAEVASETAANAAAVVAAQNSAESQSDIAADIAAAMASAEEGPNGRKGKGKKTMKPKTLPRKQRSRPIIAPRAMLKPVKFHSERIEAQSTNKYEDPEMAKLNLALAAVKEDILSTNKQITDERKWVIAVAKIIASYNDKMKRVESHIVALRKEMKALYRKKKQIENLKLQKALEAKLKEAREELSVLTNSLKHVAVKQGQLNRSGADLRQTIAGIQSQLAKLRGQRLKAPRPAAKGRKGRKGRKGGKGRKGRKGKGKRRCAKGKRYSKKAKKCVRNRRAGRR